MVDPLPSPGITTYLPYFATFPEQTVSGCCEARYSVCRMHGFAADLETFARSGKIVSYIYNLAEKRHARKMTYEGVEECTPIVNDLSCTKGN
eukprot:759462-Hanusia_phi.AAC.4